MSKILKNQTGTDIEISDTGATVPASPGQYTIPQQDYLLWAASSDIIVEIGSGDIVVNDGSNDLSISDGVDIIKGLFPSEININQSATGITSIPANVQIARGDFGDNFRTESAIGHADGVDSGSFKGITHAANDFHFLSSAQQLEVNSSSNSDDFTTGTGAKVVRITGLDSNYDELIEDVQMNGTTSVTTTNSFIRVNGLQVILAGSDGKNNGNIHTIYNGDKIEHLEADFSISNSAKHTVPSGYSGYISKGFFSTSKQNSVKVRLNLLYNGITYILAVFENHTGQFNYDSTVYYKIPATGTVFLTGKTSTGNANITAAIEMTIIKDVL